MELNLRHLKQFMKMDVLKCKTVAEVPKELTVFALSYNLVRVVILEASRRQGQDVGRISCVDALRWLADGVGDEDLPELVVNPDRPGRVEPRVVKRRPKKYMWMTRTRAEWRKRLMAQPVNDWFNAIRSHSVLFCEPWPDRQAILPQSSDNG